MIVAQLMNKPISCRPEHTLHYAAQLMWDHCIGALPVIDAQGQILGMLTDRDVCIGAYTQGRPLWEIAVETAMSRGAFPCGTDDSLSTAQAKMRDKRVRRLPVVDRGNRLVGMLSLDDLALQAAADAPSAVPAVRLDEVGATLAAICQSGVGAVTA